MLELLFQGFFEWIYGMILEMWEYFSGNLLDLMSMDFAYLQTHIPVLPVIRQSMLAVGWALLIGNLVFQALRGMLTGLGFDAEDPKLLFARTFVFSFLLLASPQICELCLNMTATIIHIMELPTAVNIDIIQESVFDGLACAWLLVFLCGIIVMFHSFKLIFEMAERYVILAVLTICAPLAFGVGGSRSTSDIFSGWCRMYGSMCLLMVLNVVFVKMLLSVLSTVPTGLAVLPWMVLVVSIVKVAKKADAIVARIGLSPAITGDSLGRSLPGMLAYVVMHTAISHAAQSAIRTAAMSGKAAGSGAQGTKQSAGSGSSRAAQNSTGKANAPRQEQTRRKKSTNNGRQSASPVKPVTVSAEDFNDAVKPSAQTTAAGTVTVRHTTRQEHSAKTSKTPTPSSGTAGTPATRKTARPETNNVGGAHPHTEQKTQHTARQERSVSAQQKVTERTTAQPPRSGTAGMGEAAKNGGARNQDERHSRNTHTLTQKEVRSNETTSARTARQEQRLSMTEKQPQKPDSQQKSNGTSGTERETRQTRLSVRETANRVNQTQSPPMKPSAKAPASAPARQEHEPVPTVTPTGIAQNGMAGTATRQTMRGNAGKPAEVTPTAPAQQEKRRDRARKPQTSAPTRPGTAGTASQEQPAKGAGGKTVSRKSVLKKGERKKRGKP